MLNFLYKSLEHAFCYLGMVALFCFQALTSSNVILWFIVCFVAAIVTDLIFKNRRNRNISSNAINTHTKA